MILPLIPTANQGFKIDLDSAVTYVMLGEMILTHLKACGTHSFGAGSIPYYVERGFNSRVRPRVTSD